MSKKRIVKKVDMPKNEKAIRRNKINKITGRLVACLCIVAFFAVAIFGSYGIAKAIWDKNIGEESGVAFNELFSILDGVTKTNEEKIVSNAFSDSDLQAFYANIKNKMFLASDYDLDIIDIVGSILNPNNSSSNTNPQQVSCQIQGTDGFDLLYEYTYADGNVVTSVVPLADSDITMDDIINSDGVETGGSTGNEALDKLLAELEFDFSSLEDYQGAKNILEISDKMLASVIDEALPVLGDYVPQIQQIEQTIGKQLEEVLEIKQVIIGGDIIKPETIKLTLTLGIRANDLVSNIIDQKGLPSILKKLVPDYLYATAIVYPNDSTKAVQVSINQLSELNVDKIISIADVILRKVNVDFNIHDMLVNVNTQIVNLLNSAQQKIPLTFVNSGNVDLYPIETLMKLLNVQISEQAFLYMMRDIKLPTEESLGYDIYTQELKDEQTGEFVDELTEQYCIDNSSNIITVTNTINDIMSLAQNQDIIKQINIKDINYATEYIAQNYRVETSYLALANMLTTYINTPNAETGEGMLGSIKASIVTMSYDENKSILTVDIKVDVAAMLGLDESSTMANLIKQLVPSEIFASASICLDENLNIATTVDINKSGADNSKAHLETLTILAQRFGMNIQDLGYEQICQKIDSAIKNGFDTIEQKIGCEIIFTKDCAYLPNIFELVSGTGYLNESEDDKLSDEDIYLMMNQAYTYEFEKGVYNKAENAQSFVGELESKYYLLSGKIVDNGDGKIMDSVMSLKDNYGTAIDKERIVSDDREIEELKPSMLESEFAYILAHNIDLSSINSLMKSAVIVGADISTDALIDGTAKNLMMIYIKSNLYEENTESTTKEGQSQTTDLSEYSNLLPENVYITVIIDLDLLTDGSIQQSCASIEFDGMTEEQMLDFFSILRKLTGEDIQKENIESQIDTKVREYMNNIDSIEYEFVDGGLEITNIFDIIASSDELKAPEGEYEFLDIDVRELLKQLYGYDYYADTRFDSGNFEIAENIEGFIQDLYDKFFISDTFKKELIDSQDENAFFDTLKQGVGGEFSTSNVRLKDITKQDETTGQLITIDGLTSVNNITIKGVQNDPDESNAILLQAFYDKFLPVFTIQEMAYMINTQTTMLTNLSFLKNTSVVYSYNDANQLGIVVKGEGNIDDKQAKALLPENIYLHMNINLGTILADGSRTDMTVYSMDINAIEYNEEQEIGGASNPVSQLEKLLLFISRIMKNTQSGSSEGDGTTQPTDTDEYTLDKVLEKTESALNEDVLNEDGSVKSKCFKNQIHNEVYTVSFLNANGGMRVNETIYEIVINQLFKEEIASNATAQPEDIVYVPDEINFRNSLCKINNMPDNRVYNTVDGKQVILDFVGSNKEEGAYVEANALNQINTKYFLNNPLTQDDMVGENKNILTSISNMANSYATAINGKAMANAYELIKTQPETNSLADLMPLIQGGELLTMLSNSMTITADGYENAQMTSLYVTRDTKWDNEGNLIQAGEMIIIFKSPVDSSVADAAYKEMLPSELVLLVKVDMAKLQTVDEECTKIAVNDLLDEEMQALNGLITKLSNNEESSVGSKALTMDLTNANKACSDNVKATMGDLTKNMKLTLTTGQTSETGTTSGTIELEDIFNVASKKLTTEERTVTADELGDMMVGLFAGVQLVGNNASADITSTTSEAEKNNKNILLTTDFMAQSGTIQGIIGDGNLLSKIDMTQLGNAFGVENMSIYQTAFVPTKAQEDTDNALNTDNVIDYSVLRNAFGSANILGDDSEYYILTFAINSSDAAGATMSILPEYIYVTVIVDLTTQSEDNISLAFNAMSQQQVDIFNHLVDINKGEGNTSGLKTENLAQIKQDLMDIEIYSSELMGYAITVTLGEVLNADGRTVVGMNNSAVTEKAQGVVVGKGAVVFNITKSII